MAKVELNSSIKIRPVFC